MDNPATQTTQDEDKQIKNTMCVADHCTQTSINNVNKT